MYDERQLIINLKTLAINDQLILSTEPVTAPQNERLENEEDEFDYVNAGLREILEVEDRYSNYLDEYWGSRWRNVLP